MGITNQRETVILWIKYTGKPLHDAIACPDIRTASFVRELKPRKGADELQNICGLPLSTHPSSVKLLWLLNNVEAVKKKYDEGKLAFGTVDTWLTWNLTGGKGGGRFVTDFTNASRTMFMDLAKREYNEKLLGFFGLDDNRIHLPKIVPSPDDEAYGTISSGVLKGRRITDCLETNLRLSLVSKASHPAQLRTRMVLVVFCSTMWESNLSFPNTACCLPLHINLGMKNPQHMLWKAA